MNDLAPHVGTINVVIKVHEKIFSGDLGGSFKKYQDVMFSIEADNKENCKAKLDDILGKIRQLIGEYNASS